VEKLLRIRWKRKPKVIAHAMALTNDLELLQKRRDADQTLIRRIGSGGRPWRDTHPSSKNRIDSERVHSIFKGGLRQ
jgi:hypothetical protein